MKRVIIFSLLIFFLATLSFSQDIIKQVNGSVVQSKILEVGQTEVKYKRFDNPDGPTYTILKSDIQNITYQNGTVDLFNEPKIPNTPALNPQAGTAVSTGTATPDATELKGHRFLIGFSGILPTGIWPATALSNMGNTSYINKYYGPVKRYGMGVMIQGRLSKNFNLFFDINTYDYNILTASKGDDAQSIWTVAESAVHWDEVGAPHIQYVHDLPTDVHFDMKGTGFRFGGKLLLGKKSIRPWVAGAFGFYEWEANYFNEDKSKTYGSDKGYVTGFTMLGGIDFGPFAGMTISTFVDMGSPVATYTIKGLFYPQWDIENDSHIMGTNRFGLTLLFDAANKAKTRK